MGPPELRAYVSALSALVHIGWVAEVATLVLPDGTPVVVTTSNDRLFRLWDLTTGHLLGVQDAVHPGESYVYRFRPTRAGTFWYHSHQSSSIQVARGLYGVLVVDPSDVDRAA